jgi:hypothetical protein
MATGQAIASRTIARDLLPDVVSPAARISWEQVNRRTWKMKDAE